GPRAPARGRRRGGATVGSVLTTHPKVLVLDEPTSALDPSAAEDVLAVLQRLVHDLGTTVLLAEHRLERVVQYADRVLLLPDAVLGTPADVMAVSPVHPPVVGLGRVAGWDPLPLTVRDARRRAGELKARLEEREAGRADGRAGHPAPPTSEVRGSGGGAPDDGKGQGGGRSLLPWRRARTATPAPAPDPTAPLLHVHRLAVRRGRVEALRRVDLRVARGETVALMGRNGAGKSTLLSTIVGMIAPTTGSVQVAGLVPHTTAPRTLIRQVGLVPQEPRDLLYAETVADECAAADADAGAPPGTCRALVTELVPGVTDTTHPRDLSEGQRLALALAVVLTAAPPLVLLDEPTRGLDYAAKARLVARLRALAAAGHAIVLATHDVELAAELADRVVIVAGGELVADGPTAEVVVSSPAFAPQVAKILAPEPWLTVEQVEEALRP
ncbi:ATP-binding cassette domain-containing protein, partial [Streptomyces sp. NPDC059762]|uniref:ATP-binding cassette domain-containing protein n=1 Tax=Streptomyces sp. NPDC059762 TaxID=3346938 RepID=UPI003669EE12